MGALREYLFLVRASVTHHIEAEINDFSERHVVIVAILQVAPDRTHVRLCRRVGSNLREEFRGQGYAGSPSTCVPNSIRVFCRPRIIKASLPISDAVLRPRKKPGAWPG
jgi:hypothetical protein